MTAKAWWISFSILDTRLVSRFTADADPVLLVGGGMCDTRARARVPMAGGAFLIAAAATCVLVRTRVVLGDVVACFMTPTNRFRRLSLLAAFIPLEIAVCFRAVESGNLGCAVGTLGCAAVTLGIATGTLGSAACRLDTGCWFSIVSCLRDSSHRCGCLSNVALVASTIRCKSFASGDVLFCPVNPLMALTHSASANITLSACVMVGLVIRLCWNCTVSDSRSLLVCLMWHVCVR